jgi:hypothetical protein
MLVEGVGLGGKFFFLGGRGVFFLRGGGQMKWSGTCFDVFFLFFFFF